MGDEQRTGRGADVVRQVLEAVERRDWEQVEPLLHPYLHWTDEEGAGLRGRRQVLARLAAAPPTAPPAEWELRDGQVYRWKEPSAR